MKLVDILARELKVWPEGVVTAVQDFDGEVKLDSHEVPRINKSKDVWIRQGDQGDSFHPKEFAEDFSYAIVTRAQWQAAVDALNDIPKFPSDEGDWNGDWLPPVGSYLEVRDEERWRGKRVKVIHNFENQIGDDMVVVESEEDASCACFNIFSLRPIRTPEQVAAEEIQRIRDEIKWQKPQLGPCPVGKMYLLGYRKFEIVDN